LNHGIAKWIECAKVKTTSFVLYVEKDYSRGHIILSNFVHSILIIN